MKQLIEWAGGNAGALNFLLRVFVTGNDLNLMFILKEKLEKCTTIRGTNLYVLYNDLCDSDMGNVLKLCEKCPDDILEDACNRQDYSGRELIKSYLS